MRNKREKIAHGIIFGVLGLVLTSYLFVPLASDGTHVVMTLEQKGSWYSPDYKVIIFGSGVVIYIGKDFAEVEGIRIARVSHEKIGKLLIEFQKADFFSMQDEYVVDFTDLSGVMTTIIMKGQTKKVWRYGNCHIPMINTAPQELCDLETSIEQAVNSKQWTGQEFAK